MSDRQSQKDALLEAALDHIAFDGWGKTSLQAAAADLDLSPVTARRLFPAGGESLLEWFDDWADRRMLEALAEMDLPSMRMRDRIAAAVRARLEPMSLHREATRRAIAARALPARTYGGFQAIWQTVDRIWTAVGDTDTASSPNYYSKRTLLAGVYTSTVMFWLEDTSDDLEPTWSFLRRRIDGVMQLQKWRGQLDRLLGRLPLPPSRKRAT